MKLQYVFGNPIGSKKKGSKKVAKKKRRKKNTRTRKNPQTTKITAYRKTRKKNKKTGKFKKVKQRVQSKTGESIATKAEMRRSHASLDLVRAKIDDLIQDKKKLKTKIARKKMTSTISKLKKKLASMTERYKAKGSLRKAELKAIKTLINDIEAAGMVAETETTRWSVAKKKRRKTRRKSKAKTRRKSKSTTKKKKRRKKASKKRRSSKKRKTKRKSTRKRKASKKGKTKKRRKSSKRKRHPSRATAYVYAPKTKRRKRRRVKISMEANPKRRRNPYRGKAMKRSKNPMVMGGMKVAGYDPMELAELGVGGMMYGAANSYITPIFAKIPGIGQFAGALGGTLPTLTAGILFNIISDKVRQPQIKKAAAFLGDGLLGAAVVGAGVYASQMLLPSPMSGVSYYPNLPGETPNYGGVDYTPELMGDINYTPNAMGDVDYTPGPSLPGENPAVDFGAYEQSAADYGEIPSGLV